ncbi:MAG: hypothetical protein HKN89_05665 [Eudoraea sp.]|nr:hypothetical protein [Eudoraea sp.]
MVTTRKSLSGKRSGHGALIRKAEHDHRNLVGLQRHLKSYACEPRTPLMFERREVLSRALDGTKAAYQTLLTNLREHRISDMSPEEEFRIQHRLFQDLENKIIAYVGDAKQSS